MQHKIIGLILCGIMLVTAACSPQSSPTLAPTLLPPKPTVLPPTENSATLAARDFPARCQLVCLQSGCDPGD